MWPQMPISLRTAQVSWGPVCTALRSTVLQDQLQYAEGSLRDALWRGAVVCPQVECKGNDCSDVKCQTVCSPPACSTSCAETCHTQCAKPKCQWRCKANPACPAPKCRMNCTNLDCATTLSAGNATAAKLKKALMRDGKVIVSEGPASLDPKVLVGAAPAPAAKVVVEEPKELNEPKVLPAAPAPAAAAPAAVPPSPAAAPAVAPAAAPAQGWAPRPESTWWDVLTGR